MASWPEVEALLRESSFRFESTQKYRWEDNGLTYFASLVRAGHNREEVVELRSRICNVDKVDFDLKTAMIAYNRIFGGLCIVENHLCVSYVLSVNDIDRLKLKSALNSLINNSKFFVASLAS